MSNIETKKPSELAIAQELNEWGQGPRVTSRDIIIPKILPIQYMSEKLQQKLAEYGELRDTVSNEKFGDLESPMEFIPICLEKKWYEFDMIPTKNGGVKREFKQILLVDDNPTSPGYNDELPMAEPGIERDRVMDFYVLIPSEIEAGTAMPYILSFRRTSLKGGKKLMTQMYMKNRAAGKSPASTACVLSVVDTSNDDGSYIVQDVRPSRPATEEEQTQALKWFKLIRAGETKVDESEFEAAPVTMSTRDDF